MSSSTATELGRLQSPRDVSAVLRGGLRRVASTFAVHLRASDPDAQTRLAVVASRRVGNAPTRNRAKRILREAAGRVGWPTGHDVVLVARPAIVGATMWDVHARLTDVLADLRRADVVPGGDR